ncbi:Sodium/hydrogen exchanger 2 [Zea mays]|uniref:Sodium/hydrogen exchanger 2 n=1 Tax=Zea mays TaxID=4577 RepID=A0A1D6J4H8_MAIZE|nr:Sodium/hydrogen exchanger 2 [Zea mays]
MLREVSLTNATFNSQLISIGALGLISRLNIGALELGDYLALGAIFSATDSICTLQVLSQDKTPFLYNHVFGEGVVNDATSVVLFNAIQNFDPRNISGAKLLNFIGSFLYLFGSSTILGVASGLLSAYTIKKLYFGRKFEGHNQVSSFIPSVWTFAFDHAFFGNAYANVIVWWAGLMRGAVSIVLAYNKVLWQCEAFWEVVSASLGTFIFVMMLSFRLQCHTGSFGVGAAWFLAVHVGCSTMFPRFCGSARHFGRDIIMPNLKSSVTTTASAVEYRDEVLKALPPGEARNEDS